MKIALVSFCLSYSIAVATGEMAFERIDPAFNQLIPADAEIEVLATGFKWSEGPVWKVDTAELLFSDVPNNVIHAWNGERIREFMRPSGYTGVVKYGREPGSNGLALDAKGQLLLAEHGDRRISVLTENGGKMTLADRFEGKRFNSPNDLVVHSSGAIYFTDPIYGLPKGENDPSREIDFCGVYRIASDGKVALITKELERPNGLAFSPDEKTLYITNSHGPRPIILAVPINPDGFTADSTSRVFFDTSKLQGKGAPDGLKVDSAGNIWSTGPGGLLLVSPGGKLLGRVLTGKATANICFGGENDATVFLTAGDSLVRFYRSLGNYSKIQPGN